MKRVILLLLLGGLFTAPVAWGQTNDDKAFVEDATKKTKEAVEGEEAAEPTWKKGGVVSLNFNQVSLINWAAGGLNSVAGSAFCNLYANYRKGKSSWDNNLDLGYGIIKQGTDPFIKSDDKIDFTSKYGQEAFNNPKFFYTGLLNFKSQFAPGYSDPPANLLRISDFLAPAYVLAAIGIDYKQSDNLSIFVSPITGKMTIVNDDTLADAGAYGVDAAVYNDAGVKTKDGAKTRVELGGYLKMQYKREIVKNVDFNTRLELFSNYIDKPENIDVFWETVFTMKVNKYLNANMGFTMIYDDDIDIAVTDQSGVITGMGPRTQYKQVLGIGLSYNF